MNVTEVQTYALPTCTHIEEGIQQTELVIQGVEKASRAGVDVGDLSAQAEETLKKLLQLKNVYFPNQ